MLLLDAVSKVH